VKHILSTALILYFTQALLGQSPNLVPNHGFELYTTCPDDVAQINRILDWDNVANHGGSADYLQVCATDPIVQVPTNAFGTQGAALGDGYIGLALLYFDLPDFREYVQVQLTSAMQAGSTYIITLKLCLAESSQFATDRFGVHISNAPLTGTGSYDPLPVAPQLSVTPGDYMTDMQNWTVFTFPYGAQGGEEYLTFGNFTDDAGSSVINTNTGIYSASYIYIDEVEVYLSSSTCITQFEMPNVFTPNNDNENDVFVPVHSEGVNGGTLTIYNRWGKAIYTTFDVLTGWKGTSDGKPAPEGVYYWISTYNNCNEEEKQTRGNVTLLR
jgi:gliding motility-associated-like protein